ncbi:retrotransposon protein, putative, ty1-copia subclass [Tanacetum coccineum]
MVPTNKVDKTPYELWYGKVPNLSYLKVWGCELLVKRDTPDKLQQIYVKYIFIGYPKETMGYYFYFPSENKIVVARYVEFFEKNLITQKVSGRAIDLEEIQDEDTSPSEITSEIPMGLKEHSLRDLNEPTSYKVAMLDLESNKWIDAMNAKMQSMIDNMASESNVTFLILYVDDIIIMGNHIPSLQSVKDYLGKCFAMKDLGEAAFILGIKIYRDRFLVYGRNLEAELRVDCYCNARFETNRDDTKYQTGYVFILNGGTVDWKSSKQSTTAMSAIEAEYIAASEAAMEAVWIRKFISGLGIVPTINEPIRMFCDNSAALQFANEPGVQRGARHYHMRYHYVHDSIALGEIRFLKVHIDDNLADPFMKALSKGKLTQHARSMGLRLASSFM